MLVPLVWDNFKKANHFNLVVKLNHKSFVLPIVIIKQNTKNKISKWKILILLKICKALYKAAVGN